MASRVPTTPRRRDATGTSAETPPPRRDERPERHTSLIGAFPLVDLDAHRDGDLLRACARAASIIEQSEMDGVDVFAVPASPDVIELHQLTTEIIATRPKTHLGAKMRKIFLVQDVAVPENRALGLVIVALYSSKEINTLAALNEAELAYDRANCAVRIRRDRVIDEIVMVSARQDAAGHYLPFGMIRRSTEHLCSENTLKRRLRRLVDVGLLSMAGRGERDVKMYLASEGLLKLCRDRIRLMCLIAASSSRRQA